MQQWEDEGGALGLAARQEERIQKLMAEVDRLEEENRYLRKTLVSRVLGTAGDDLAL